MNYPFILKFSSITHLTDARYAAGMWADFVGFCFNPNSESFIEPQKAKQIIDWINGPIVVGEFNHQPKDWIADFVNEIGLKAIQLPANYDDLSVSDLDVKIILEILDPLLDMPLLSKAHLILVHSDEAYQFMKSRTELPIIVKAFDGINCESYEGVELEGEKEIAIGFRDHDKWNKILEPYTN